MSGQGFHFAIRPQEATDLFNSSDSGRVFETIDALMAGWDDDSENTAGGYKEWDVLQRVLSDGTFDPTGGVYPFNQCFLGGKLLVTEGGIVNLIPPNEVADVADSLSRLDADWFRQRFMTVFGEDYPKHTSPELERDCGEFWEMFEELRSFYQRASAGRRAVVFYTDDPLDWFQRANAELTAHPWSPSGRT